MNYCLNLAEYPQGFRQTGYCHLPLKAFLEMPYRQFQFYVFLLQRANWGRNSEKQGWFIFRYKSLEFQSNRYTQTCVKNLLAEGYIAQFSRVKGMGEGVLAKEFLGPRRGSVPLQNQFLTEAISSEHAFIFAKILLLSRIHPAWNLAKIRSHLTQYRSINPKFYRDFNGIQGRFSEPMPKRPGQFAPRPSVLIGLPQGGVKVANEPSLEIATVQPVPQFPRESTVLPPKCTGVPPSEGAPNIGIRTKDFYENITIKVSDQQKRDTYRIPKDTAERLRSSLTSLDAKYKLNVEESNFVLSVAHSLSLKDHPQESPEVLLKTSYAAYWFCTQKNRNIRTKSCLWNRVYAYSLHNHGDWLWREFQSLSRPRVTLKPTVKPSAQPKESAPSPIAQAIEEVHRKAEQERLRKQCQFELYLDHMLPAWRNDGALTFSVQQRYYRQFLNTWNPGHPPASSACSFVGGGMV